MTRKIKYKKLFLFLLFVFIIVFCVFKFLTLHISNIYVDGNVYLSDQDIEFGPLLSSEKCATFKEKYSERIEQINTLLKNSNLPKEKVNSLIAERSRIESVL